MTRETSVNRELLESIESEAIHRCNCIQGHGILLVLEEASLKIVQVSQNTAQLLSMAPESLLNTFLEELLDPFQFEGVRNNLNHEDLDFVNPTKLWIRKIGDDYAIFDGIFHRNSDGLLILELEPATTQESIPFLSFYHLARASIDQLQKTTTLAEVSQVIVEEVRRMTGYDRVMLYKFDTDGHGAVIAEDKLETLEPYLGLHYPESDIPKQARKLFAFNWIRMIPDTRATSAAIIPGIHPHLGHSIDLTRSSLRSPSSCHLEYLHNMGVGASLTISLIENGKLWGLIACHHQTPRYIAYELRKACEFLGRVIFSEIEEREETAHYSDRVRLNGIHSQLIDLMSQEENFVDGLVGYEVDILSLIDAGGGGGLFWRSLHLFGRHPQGRRAKIPHPMAAKTDDGRSLSYCFFGTVVSRCSQLQKCCQWIARRRNLEK